MVRAEKRWLLPWRAYQRVLRLSEQEHQQTLTSYETAAGDFFDRRSPVLAEAHERVEKRIFIVHVDVFEETDIYFSLVVLHSLRRELRGSPVAASRRRRRRTGWISLSLSLAFAGFTRVLRSG